MSYSKLSKNPERFDRFIGLKPEEFNRLFQKIEKEYPQFEIERLSRKDRINAIGQGRKPKLSLKEMVIMFLCHYKMYITEELTGFLFDINQSNVNRIIRKIEPLMERCLPTPKKMRKKIKRIGKLEELEKIFPELKAFVDGTEQPIPRPKNRRRRKSYYSGKKKKHTVKLQVITNKDGLVIDKSKHHKGRTHDYEMFKKRKPKLPPDIELTGDSGYQGIQKDFPNLKSRIPIKKSKGGKLTKEQKKYNKKLSKERVVVENSIGKGKRFKIFGEKFRNRLNRYDMKTEVVFGLVNFKML
ncbi:MAG: transposase [Candidatus Aenigmarchaeota archaeon]|nr:transposase [Candidatus Aenigmarchaeota archaeon]